MPTQGLPKQDGQCNTLIETQALLTLPIVRAFAAHATTTPSADFCYAVRTPLDVLSHEYVTHSRSPAISSTAVHARPPDLPPVPLMDMGFPIVCSLARHRRPLHPVLVHRPACLLYASSRPHLAMTPLRFATLHLHQVGRGLSPPSCRTCTAYIGIGGRVTSPPLPHHRTGGSRIRRFDKFVPRITTWAGRSQFGDAVRVSLLGLASVAASPRCAYPRPAEAGWPVQYPHRDPSTTDPSYRSGLRRSRDYYALC